MNGPQKETPPPPSCVFQFYSTFRPFPLMNTGLISGLVEEEAADVNEVAAGFQYSPLKEAALSGKEKHADYHNKCCRAAAAGHGLRGSEATLLILVLEPRIHFASHLSLCLYPSSRSLERGGKLRAALGHR